MMTFQNLAKAGVTAGMAGIGSSGGLSGLKPMAKPEMQAKAVTRIMEMNTIGNNKEKKSGLGMGGSTYNSLGRLGGMIALKRAGSSMPQMLGSNISLKV